MKKGGTFVYEWFCQQWNVLSLVSNIVSGTPVFYASVGINSWQRFTLAMQDQTAEIEIHKDTMMVHIIIFSRFYLVELLFVNFDSKYLSKISIVTCSNFQSSENFNNAKYIINLWIIGLMWERDLPWWESYLWLTDNSPQSPSRYIAPVSARKVG